MRQQRRPRADCPTCKGTGFFKMHFSTACGMPISEGGKLACDCSPEAVWNAFERDRKAREARERKARARRRERRESHA